MLKPIFSSREAGSLTTAVIGQDGLWRPLLVDVVGECVHHIHASDTVINSD